MQPRLKGYMTLRITLIDRRLFWLTITYNRNSIQVFSEDKHFKCLQLRTRTVEARWFQPTIKRLRSLID